MEGRLCKIGEDRFFVVPGFEKTAYQYFDASYDPDHALVMTDGTFEIPPSAIRVAEGLWKEVA